MFAKRKRCSRAGQLRASEDLELRAAVGIHHRGRFRSRENCNCSRESRQALRQPFTRKCLRRWFLAESAGSGERDVAVGEVLSVRRSRTQRHRLQLATAPASHDPECGEGQQKEEQPRSKTAHGDLSFMESVFEWMTEPFN